MYFYSVLWVGWDFRWDREMLVCEKGSSSLCNELVWFGVDMINEVLLWLDGLVLCLLRIRKWVVLFGLFLIFLVSFGKLKCLVVVLLVIVVIFVFLVVICVVSELFVIEICGMLGRL